MKTGLTVLALGLLLLSTAASASEVKKTVASFNITPCSRVTYYKDSLGITWPTVQFADQSVDLNVVVSGNENVSVDEILDTINTCDQVAIGVGVVAGSFSANPEAFAGAYEVSFNACAGARLASDLTGVSVHADSSCHW